MAALELVPANHRADWRIHRVVPGETLADIAHRYATAVSALTSANQRAALDGAGVETPAAPVAGDLLVVPVASHVSHAAVRSTSSHGKLQRRALTARRVSVNKPARRVRGAAYRTASLASKHRVAAN
jgi:hypothetical protein